ncbi:retrovirus-related pol polyprotein from transposon TNT 1-94 [Tanacetum coccineum]
MQQLMQNPDEITDPTTTMNMALVLMAKAFKLNYYAPINNNQRISLNPRNRHISQPGMNIGQHRQMQTVRGNGGNQFRQYAGQNAGNQIGYNVGQISGNQNEYNAVQNAAARAECNGNRNNGNQIRCYNCRGLGHYARNCTVRPSEIDEIEEVNVNCILMANLQQASTSGTQTDTAPVYNSDGSAENNSNVIPEDSSMDHSGGTVEQHPTTVEETRAYFESLYINLAIKVEKVNTVNFKMKEAIADLTTELARYKGKEKCFEFNQAKFDELENGYKKSVYQEQCLTKKINDLHLSYAKMVTTLNEKIANLNNQLSKEKSIVSYLQEEREKLKSDFETHEYDLLDKLIQSKKKIKELDNILVKTGSANQEAPQGGKKDLLLSLGNRQYGSLEHVKKGTIELYFVKTDYQLADIFTKALSVDMFNCLVRRFEVICAKNIKDYLKPKDQDIKNKDKDIKLKIKIQDHKYAKGTAKKFSRIKGSKIHDVTRSEAIFTGGRLSWSGTQSCADSILCGIVGPFAQLRNLSSSRGLCSLRSSCYLFWVSSASYVIVEDASRLKSAQFLMARESSRLFIILFPSRSMGGVDTCLHLSLLGMLGLILYLLLPQDMVTHTIDIVTSVLTQRELDHFCNTYNILADLGPQLPGRKDMIRDALAGKIRIYTRFLEFANFRVPLSRFLLCVLEYYQINFS